MKSDRSPVWCRRFTALLASLAIAAPVSAPAQASPKTPTTVPVRFYCGDFRVVTKYVKLRNGMHDVAPPVFGERPPSRVFVPGKPGKPTSILWAPGRITPVIQIPAADLHGGKLILCAQDIESALPAPSPATPGGSAKKAPELPLVPFAEFELPPAPTGMKTPPPQLAVVYQPDSGGRWMPPKSLLVNLSPEAFPIGACVLMNLSAYPAQGLVGGSGSPVTVKPGEAKVVQGFSRDADGYALVRLAIATPESVKVLVNAPRPFPKDGRQLLVIGAIDPRIGGGLPATVKILPID